MNKSSEHPIIQCMSHVTMCVRDLKVAEDFYVGVLGGRLTRRMDRAEFLRQRPDRAGEADAPNSPLHIAVKFGDEDRFELQLFRHASLYFFDPFGNHLELESTGFHGQVSFGPPEHGKLPYSWAA